MMTLVESWKFSTNKVVNRLDDVGMNSLIPWGKPRNSIVDSTPKLLFTYKFIILFFLCVSTLPGNAQTPKDSASTSLKSTSDTSVVKRHSPKKAVLYSLVIPGAGQIYNKKYWKTPLVYGALGSTIYFARQNHLEYRGFWEAFLQRTDTNNLAPDAYEGIYSEGQLISLMNQRLQQRDFMIILAVLAFTLQLVDAYVDAHLFEYDISDNLTMQWRPEIQMQPGWNTTQLGIHSSFRFGSASKKQRQLQTIKKFQ